MKIRYGLGVATVLVATIALAGCSGSPAPAASDGSVSGTLTGVFDVNFKDTMEEIVANFEKKYPDVKVEFNYQGGDVGGLISTQLQANTAPDILLTFPGGDAGSGANVNVVTLASQGKLMDLSDQAWTNEVPEIWQSEVAYKDKTYAYPGAAQPLAAIYNQDALDDAGLTVPETLSDVYELCEAAAADGMYAYAQGLGETLAGPQMLSFGQTASLVYGPDPDFKSKLDDGSATYQDSAWVDQFEIYQKMFDEGCFGEGALGRDRKQGGDAVAAGKAFGIVDVGAAKSAMVATSPDTQYVVAGIPASDDGDLYVTALPGYTVAANAAAKNPTAAAAFMEFLAEPAQSVIYANGFSSVPIIPNDEYTAPADLEPFAALLASGQYAKLPNLGAPEVQVALNEGVQSLLLGDDTPESVAEKMQDAFDAANK
ncbi:extracellular solute-binding protein [Microbacterium yannicii]|uniref:Extracellular solute-binding protein n=1 Tax=Microbacterium yannicii TaxID=671622 RepID=A0ABP9M438_9MICO|nr:extracellular solute-binding protein [Microbacterium yannicii]MCO5954434.1 extracellular solute-binding protein [Microbacterium yannicii]